ncbi:MAG TPA: HNH endonuclease, partial [Candidatus Dormibacteraeota bacterium]
LPISAKAVERLACDCSLTRILLNSDSMVIDVGRAKRQIPTGTRKALNARDQHCVWPGCDRPASWASGHHLVHWIHGGSTDLPNLALLCYRHHWMVHEGGWQILRGDGGRMVTIPPTVTFGPSPRGPD